MPPPRERTRFLVWSMDVASRSRSSLIAPRTQDKFLVQSMPVDAAMAEQLLKQTKDYTEMFTAAPSGGEPRRFSRPRA